MRHLPETFQELLRFKVYCPNAESLKFGVELSFELIFLEEHAVFHSVAITTQFSASTFLFLIGAAYGQSMGGILQALVEVCG